MSKTNDEKRRDEVLKRMLSTPPKPHDGGLAKRDKPPPDDKPTNPAANKPGR